MLITRRLIFALGITLLALLAKTPMVVAADNAITIENRKVGNPQSDWYSGSGDSRIQGFTTDISYNAGATARFKVNAAGKVHRIDIYRLGYYGGLGSRKVASVNGIAVNQPACTTVAAFGLVDCGNWSVTATWAIPADAVSGLYVAQLVRTDVNADSNAYFVVRNDSRRSDLLFQTSDTTWQAYNLYGGTSLYTGGIVGRAYKVSYNRPFEFVGSNSPLDAEYPMIRWLEANGYDVAYQSGVDTDRFGSNLLNHRVFMTVGHDEYWSGQQRTNVEAARAAGVHLAFFSGNDVFWKTRWENSIDGTNTPYRTLPVTYKETLENKTLDPLDPPVWTGTWRDPRFSPPGDGGRPENALTGTLFTVNGPEFDDLRVPGTFAGMRFWRNTRVANLGSLQTATLGKSMIGYEWNEDVDNGFRPRGLVQLSSTTTQVSGKILDYGSSYGPGTAVHSLTLYRASSGALVFSAGTVGYSWGLDTEHENNQGAPVGPADPAVQQATVNLFAEMGTQPASLQTGLLPAVATTDRTPPTSTINPISGNQANLGQVTTITGTAADVGGGVVGGVEISINGGAWRRATGRENWTYSWVPSAIGTATIRVAAVDDIGNLQTSGPSLTVNVVNGAPATRIWTNSDTPAVPSALDPNPVELGMKFISDVSGSITGIWFYKGASNTGQHFGHLWKGDGTLLGTATFSNETATGWQFASFPQPIGINANTTYIASYHAPNGGYSVSSGYFAAGGRDSVQLHALGDGIDGPNGVYAYGPSGFPLFPSSSYQSSNYWVDVQFSPTIVEPPAQTPHTTIWANTAVPSIISANDSDAVELGVKFRVDAAGSITGIRYYKSAENTGTHVGRLWTSSGQQLATVTFTGETSVGWQQADFSTPVVVTPGVTYVASYYAPAGHYSADLDYFTTKSVDSPPLYALKEGTDGSNGLYKYGASGFPTNSYRSSNYWVDVVFAPDSGGTQVAALSATQSTAALSTSTRSTTTQAAAVSGKKIARPRKLSKLKYPLNSWRAADGGEGEAYNTLKRGARGKLNGGKIIDRYGK